MRSLICAADTHYRAVDGCLLSEWTHPLTLRRFAAGECNYARSSAEQLSDRVIRSKHVIDLLIWFPHFGGRVRIANIVESRANFWHSLMRYASNHADAAFLQVREVNAIEK